LQAEVRDCGSYLLILRLSRDRRTGVGHLGSLRFRRGFYVYAGSAMRNLSGRIAWHHRRRKHLHWHIDHLRQVSDDIVSLPIRSSQREECAITQALAGALTPGPAGFGCSDCRCPTHLFHSPANPFFSANFHTLLQKFRMKSPC
jgi:sugar fermentation stimulation protein A